MRIKRKTLKIPLELMMLNLKAKKRSLKKPHLKFINLNRFTTDAVCCWPIADLIKVKKRKKNLMYGN